MTEGLSDLISHVTLYHPEKFVGHKDCGFGDVSYMSCDLRRPCELRALWLYGKELLKVSHHPATFGGHGYCGSGNIMVLGSCDFMGRGISR